MTLGLIQIQSLSKSTEQKLQLHSQKQQSPVVTSAHTLQEQHWQMVRILFQSKHLILMETLQQLRQSHLRLIQFRRHLHLQIQQRDLSQINPAWLYLVKQMMRHLNLLQLQSMERRLQLTRMVHSQKRLSLSMVLIQLQSLPRIRLERQRLLHVQ
nr:MAG TPA: hypothetical protein [Caudoviricetes sp.]